jgi:hypothetical protein
MGDCLANAVESDRRGAPEIPPPGREDERVPPAELILPSAGPDPIPWDTALAAILGYARGRRPLYFRSPSHPEGRWVHVPAFGYARFDVRPRSAAPLGEADILPAEGLHGRLDPAGWAALRTTLEDVRPLADAAIEAADGRPLGDLPGDEFSVLAEPGTVGAALREIRGYPQTPYVTAALHHRRPDLFPLLVRSTLWALLPHVREGDSGVEAVIHRELRANADAFARLEAVVAARLGIRTTPLRLHDVLLWLTAGLRLAHAVRLGLATDEWRAAPAGR